MNLFESIIVSIIMMVFPVLCYLFYIVSDKNFDEIKKNIVLKFTLVSTFYLLNKYSLNSLYNYALLTIPLFLSYKKNYTITTIVLLISIIFISFVGHDYYFYFLICEMIVLFIFNREKKPKLYIFTTALGLLLYTFIFDFDNSLINITYILSFMIGSTIVLYTITKGEDIICYHIEYKDLKKENELRRSLFKITHEIKNPLAVCKAYVDIFNYDDPECAKKYVPIISNEIDKMLLLLQDFLLVNKDNINFDIMDINMMLEDLTDSLLEIYKMKVELDCSEDEIFINGDYNRLTQVVTNLIKNSYEANADKIVVKSYVDNENVVVEVIDNGDGISKNIYKNIYEPFFTTKRDGTGLGVPLSKEIVEAHNGTLNYYENSTKGTIAKILLPINEV